MNNRVKNRNDSRYQKVQSRLERALGKFLKRGHVAKLQISELSHAANVYDSTFYDHYKNLDLAFAELNTAMESELEALKAEIMSGHFSLEITFVKILFFIHKKHDYYDTYVSCEIAKPLLNIVRIFRPLINRGWNNYTFSLFAWEFSGLIFYWGKYEHFNEKHITKYAKQLVKLSKSFKN